MPFIKEINPNTPDSHQTNPGAVITIVRWANRNPYIGGLTSGAAPSGIETRSRPLVIQSDIVNVAFSHTKTSLTPQFTAVLTAGDVNYRTAIHEGDFAFLNIVNFQTKQKEIADRAIQGQPINNLDDGFCGVFRIQSVKRVLQSGENGVKTYAFQIVAAGFTEFNNVLYFNPAISAAFSSQGGEVYQFYLGDYFATKLKTVTSCQEILEDLFTLLIGQSKKQNDGKLENYGNQHFKLPTAVGKLLGRQDAKYASQMFNYVLGIWGSSKDSPTAPINKGLNPGITSNSSQNSINTRTEEGKQVSVSNYYKTATPIQGDVRIGLDNWNSVTAWSILKMYVNDAVNEIYTCYRPSPDNNTIMPTIVVRQKPFTSKTFNQNIPNTKFLDLPRWKIDPMLITSIVTGGEEAARINFVQVFTRALAETADQDQATQITLGNFFYDKEDIQRSGLRPYIISSNFDHPGQSSSGKESFKALRARPWAMLNADWVIGAHLKESGGVECVGLEEPISVGDNLECDGIVYHLESISKNLFIGGDGKLKFTTSLKVSNGVDLRSDENQTVYPEMVHSDTFKNRVEDANYEGLLPGYSDTQDTPGRTNGEEVTNKDADRQYTKTDVKDKKK